MSEWTVFAQKIGEKSGFVKETYSTERVISYHFINHMGRAFRIKTLDDGRLEVSVDAQLVIRGTASNLITLDATEHNS